MKTLEGNVISTKMQNTAIVKVVRRVPHPLYKKLLKRNKKIKADTKEVPVLAGQRVRIVETKPISKDKHFKVIKILNKEIKTIEVKNADKTVSRKRKK